MYNKRSYETNKLKPTSQKETSPLAHFVRNSLPHKSFRFCSPMQKHMESANGNQTMIQPYRPFQDKLPSPFGLSHQCSFCNIQILHPRDLSLDVLLRKPSKYKPCRGSYCRNGIIRWNHAFISPTGNII